VNSDSIDDKKKRILGSVLHLNDRRKILIKFYWVWSICFINKERLGDLFRRSTFFLSMSGSAVEPAFHRILNFFFFFFFAKIECGLYFLDRFDVLISKMIFKKWKNIISIYFGTKSYLKSNHYHTAKHPLKWQRRPLSQLLSASPRPLGNLFYKSSRFKSHFSSKMNV